MPHAIAEGELLAAYRSLEGIAGIRSAFFTKFLYFFGRSSDPSSHYPLILDAKVAASLSRLLGLRGLVSLGSYSPRDDAASYVRYVSVMHDWAQSLGISADALEFYLWQPTGAFAATCDRLHGYG